MSDVAQVRERVQKALAELFDVEADGENLSVGHGSVTCAVRVFQPDPDAPVYVRLRVPLLTQVPESEELHRYVAYHADDYLFGHLSLSAHEDGVADVYFTYTLLGDVSDIDLTGAVAAVAFSADSLDDRLQAQFGGHKHREE